MQNATQDTAAKHCDDKDMLDPRCPIEVPGGGTTSTNDPGPEARPPVEAAQDPVA